MKQQGKDILEAVRQVRRFHCEVASLLGTAAALMDMRGWTGAGGNIATAGGSTAIYAPQLWGPQMAFRFFKHPKAPNVLAFVSVIIDDVDREERVQEPLISAGFYDYGDDGKAGNNWQYDYARWHLGMPGRTDDGAPYSTDPRQTWPKSSHPMQRVTTFALPLVSVGDGSTLEQRVVEPLVAEIRKDCPQI